MTEPTALPAPAPLASGTPLSWRLSIGGAVLLTAIAAWLLQPSIGTRGQALAGVVCFFGLVATFSSNLRAVNWRTIGWGLALQITLALLVLKVPCVKDAFNAAKVVVVNFISFSDKGAEFVFGNLARPGDIALNPGKELRAMSPGRARF